MISAMYANSSYDESKTKRQPLVEQMEQSFTEAVNAIYGWKPPELDLSKNPFFAAIRLPQIDPELLEEAERDGYQGFVLPDGFEIDQPLD